MNSDRFWAIVEKSLDEAGGDTDMQNDLICEALCALSKKAIIGFDAEFDRCRSRACTRALWGAAYLINGGCSNDGFEYFRAWLISRGRAVFEAALQDPDSLADHTDRDRDNYENEDFMYVGRRAYEESTGRDAEYETGVTAVTEPEDEEWDFDDDEEMARRYPRLFSRSTA